MKTFKNHHVLLVSNECQIFKIDKSHLQARYFYPHFQEFRCLSNELAFSLVFRIPDIIKAIL